MNIQEFASKLASGEKHFQNITLVGRHEDLVLARHIDLTAQEQWAEVDKRLKGYGYRGMKEEPLDFSYSYLDWLRAPELFIPYANMEGASLERTDLRRADLRGTILAGSSLYKADLRGAILRRADLLEADLAETILDDADLKGAFCLGKEFLRAYFEEAKGLDSDVIDEINKLKRRDYD